MLKSNVHLTIFWSPYQLISDSNKMIFANRNKKNIVPLTLIGITNVLSFKIISEESNKNTIFAIMGRNKSRSLPIFNPTNKYRKPLYNSLQTCRTICENSITEASASQKDLRMTSIYTITDRETPYHIRNTSGAKAWESIDNLVKK